MTVHPAASVLADHLYHAQSRAADGFGTKGVCECREWRGWNFDHPAHLADVLYQAGLLADGTPPETPTARVLAEGDPWAYLGERVGEIQARRLACGRCGAVAVPDGSTPIGLPQDWERFIVKGEARYACPACIEAAT